MDVDGHEEKTSSTMKDDIISFSVTASAQSFSTLTWQSKEVASTIEAFLDLLLRANTIQSRQIALAPMTALGTVFNSVNDGISVQLQKKQAKVDSILEKLLFQQMFPSYGSDFKLQ